MIQWFKNLGPGVLVSAAFIGPGTVTVCTLAGVEFGFSLLWALLLSIVACLILQEMAARVGLVTQKGLSEVIREEIGNPFFRSLSILLIFAAIVIGNAAYEAGNISGAVLGVSAVIPVQVLDLGIFSINIWSLTIGLIAFSLLAIGNYKVLEKLFIGLVAIMSISFLVTAVITKPNLSEVLQGLFIPRNGGAGILTVMALIGTTVVPYNLFLHASLVSEKWKDKSSLKTAQKELFWSISLGGLVSLAIVITAAASGVVNVNTAVDLAAGLEPVFGSYATWFIALGLFAAGITSSITAPLAAAYVVSGCMGWKKSLTSRRFKMVWAGILLLGMVFSSLGFQPVEIIKFAQVANGILLPVIAIFLLWVVNRRELMGSARNSLKLNILGFAIIAVTIFLGARSIITVLESLYS
ncbi:Nramp family divalent metal transporter [Salinimicrobium sp. TH3]|uniref:Nramp family divalent metal transporter n=1 Tax=Salinimicrobium sp. TH3 TaxID=2997342 RepID=UPI0022746736|nr:Nramp family divalent metal transporter [Salinimicrobium sp. TH3]MCY2686878.1 Nramp family divalent metal transporter [Salinimicrobium sp. TH3]